MNQHQTKIIILRRIDYGEADRILTVISPDNGKISLLAKGARKSKSKLAGGLELFSTSSVSFIDGKSDLKTVVSTQLICHYSKIVSNIDATMMAYDFLKLIDTLTEAGCESTYYDLLNHGLVSLNDHNEELPIVYVWFVSQALGLVGTGLGTETQISGKLFEEDKLYNFDYDDMGFVSHESGQFGPKHIKFLRLLAKVSKPENLLNIAGRSVLANDLKPLLENCIKFNR